MIRVQKPLRLKVDTELEPDVAVVPGSRRDYARRHPETAILVVEVADTSVALDLTRKAHLYARASIPEYWVLTLPERVLVAHRDPDPAAGEYRTICRAHAEESVTPLAAPNAPLPVVELLP